MATVTDLVAGSGAGGVLNAAAGYTQVQATYRSNGQLVYTTKYSKWIPQVNSGYFEFMGLGASTVDQPTADTAALNALNANRRHRYAGSPGATSPATVVPDAHGDTHTVDVN